MYICVDCQNVFETDDGRFACCPECGSQYYVDYDVYMENQKINNEDEIKEDKEL